MVRTNYRIVPVCVPPYVTHTVLVVVFVVRGEAQMVMVLVVLEEGVETDRFRWGNLLIYFEVKTD